MVPVVAAVPETFWFIVIKPVLEGKEFTHPDNGFEESEKSLHELS